MSDSSTLAPKRSRFAKHRTLGVATALILGAIVWSGSRRVSTGPADGTTFNGEPSIASATQPQSPPPRLRLGTFNIHGGRGTDGLYDLDRTAESLRGLDLAGLNEVHGAYPWETGDQAEILGRKLNLSWLFAPTESRFWREHFGNGVLTRLPVTSWQRIPLPRRYGRSHRNLVLMCVQHAGRGVHVVVTHADRSDDRERANQVRTAGELFLALAEPAVLLGDLNTRADEPELQRILCTPGVHDPLTEALGQDVPRIDWILTRGLRGRSGGIHKTGASDHPAYWVECE